MASGTFSVGDLTAVIGDNAASGQHRAGYNGIWSLTHKTQDRSIFVPAVAGMNLEHIYDGETLDAKGETKIFFEPRNATLTFQRLVGGWAGLYENTPDRNAMIGRAEVPGVMYAVGFSGHGFLQGPAVGEIIRDLYLDRDPFMDPAPFSAARFATGSVLREVHIV